MQTSGGRFMRQEIGDHGGEDHPAAIGRVPRTVPTRTKDGIACVDSPAGKNANRVFPRKAHSPYLVRVMA
jgi:hypothetical protein